MHTLVLAVVETIVSVLRMSVCLYVSGRHFLKSLLDAPTMASLYFLSCAGINRCLSPCAFFLFCFVCACASVFVRRFNEEVPLCYTSTPSSVMLQGRKARRGEIRGGMSIGSGRAGTTFVNKRRVAASPCTSPRLP